MLKNENIKQTRVATAKILVDVVLGKISVLEGIKALSKDTIDPSCRVCFHILVHLESDEEIRAKDQLYKETQDEFIVETAEILARGEALPVNIIKEYSDFYDSDLLYKKDTKENIIKRLKRIINI